MTTPQEPASSALAAPIPDPTAAPDPAIRQLSNLFESRERPVLDFAEQAAAVAAACHQMAARFHQGGKLVVLGTGGPSTDAQHVAVEFVHPVIVGKRALPAISLTSDVATVTARELGMLTIALVGGNGGAIAACTAVDHLLVTRSADPRIVKELQVTTYHVLWELVHVFFEQPGLLAPAVVA